MAPKWNLAWQGYDGGGARGRELAEGAASLELVLGWVHNRLGAFCMAMEK